MGSLIKFATMLEKKKIQTGASRRKDQRALLKVKKTLRRSSSGLHAIERNIQGAHESLTVITKSLSEYQAREDSVRSLIEITRERLEREEVTRKEAANNLKSENNEERRRSITWRINSLTDTIAHLQTEIKSRKKILKKISDEVNRISSEKLKLTTSIKKKRLVKPELARLVKSGKKYSATLTRKISSKSRQEDNAVHKIKKIKNRLEEISAKRRKASAKKRSASLKRIKKSRSKKVKRATSKPKKRTIKKRTVKRTKTINKKRLANSRKAKLKKVTRKSTLRRKISYTRKSKR